MADPRPLVFKLELDTSAFEKQLNKSRSRMEKFRDGFVTAAAAIAIAGAGIRAVTGAIKALGNEIDRIGTLQGVQQSFERLAQSIGGAEEALTKLRDATDGTVRDVDLMREANRALQLGLVDSADQFAEMADLAQRLGRSVGTNATKSIQQLVSVLSRGTPRGLARLNVDAAAVEMRMDALAGAMGKTRTELSKTEQITLLTRAAMDQMRETAEMLGPEQLTVSELWSQIATGAGNAVDRIRVWIADSPEFQGALRALSFGMRELTKQGGFLDRIMQVLSGPRGRIPLLGRAFAFIIDVISNVIAAFPAFTAGVRTLLANIISAIGAGLGTAARVVADFLEKVNQALGGKSRAPTRLRTFFADFEVQTIRLAKQLNRGAESANKDAVNILQKGQQVQDLIRVFTEEQARQQAQAAQGVPGLDEPTKKKKGTPTNFAKEFADDAGKIIGAARQMQGALDAAFAGSGKSAERWKRVSLGVTAAISTAEAIKEFAAGMGEIGNAQGGGTPAAVAHFISSAAWGVAAGVAGAQAAGAIPSGGGGAGGAMAAAVPEPPDIADEERAARITQVSIIIEGDLVANADWVRTRLIPRVNEIVRREEATVLATDLNDSRGGSGTQV